MSARVVSDAALARLSRLLLERVGLRTAAETGTGLRLALLARMEARREADAEAYVERLERDGGDELRALLPLVTVGKTEFFRDANQFKALRQTVLPQLLARSRHEMRKLRIWSAGCATGEEPYSLAMVLAELEVESDGSDILATDVNPQAVAQAAAGRFSSRRLQGISEAALRRHFAKDGDDWVAGPALRARIRFATNNLAGAASYPLPKDGPPWDLILCRNVLIYFEREGMVGVLRRFHEALAPGGYLCLGYSESLFRVNVEFELAEIAGSFLYRRPGPPRPRRPSRENLRAVAPPRKAEAVRPSPPRRGPRTTPKPMPAVPPLPPELPAQPAPHEPVEDAFTLLEQGRFEQATQLLERALARSPDSIPVLLTHGNAKLVMRDLAAAQRDYRRALELEPLCAEAHLFLGIARAEEGPHALADALREVNRAIFLAPHLSLAHYWAGRLSEKAGDRPAARRAYRNAIEATRGSREEAPLLGYVPDLPAEPAMLARAARYALAALEEP